MIFLQKWPKGLLEVFRIRDGGRAPSGFGEAVQPVVDVSMHYASDILIMTTGAPTVGALNISENTVFSATLRVHAICGQLTIGAAAATNVSVAWGFTDIGSVNSVCVGSQFFAQIPAGIGVHFGCMVPPGLVVPPGWGFYARAGGTAAGVDHSLSAIAIVENFTAV